MKNQTTVTGRLSFLRRSFLSLFLLFSITQVSAQVGTVYPSNKKDMQVPIKPNGNSISITNPVYTEIFNKIKSGQKCYQVKVSSVSTKNYNYGFVSYALGNLERDGNTYNLIIKGLSTEIDDRNNFQGAKTQESMVIYTQGNAKVGVNVNLKTWGNKTLRLTDVKLNKEPYGYFITGKVTDGNRTVYYTIGIYEYNCLI